MDGPGLQGARAHLHASVRGRRRGLRQRHRQRNVCPRSQLRQGVERIQGELGQGNDSRLQCLGERRRAQRQQRELRRAPQSPAFGKSVQMLRLPPAIPEHGQRVRRRQCDGTAQSVYQSDDLEQPGCGVEGVHRRHRPRDLERVDLQVVGERARDGGEEGNPEKSADQLLPHGGLLSAPDSMSPRAV